MYIYKQHKTKMNVTALNSISTTSQVPCDNNSHPHDKEGTNKQISKEK